VRALPPKGKDELIAITSIKRYNGSRLLLIVNTDPHPSPHPFLVNLCFVSDPLSGVGDYLRRGLGRPFTCLMIGFEQY